MEIWIPIIISLFALIWSIIQSNQQQKLANQHHLWDRRIKQYRVLQSIMHAYKEHRSLLWSQNELQEDIAEAADQLYGWMSNYDVVRTQLTQQIQDPEHQHIAIQDFLHDCVEQTKVLWDAPIANLASQMIEAYMNLLHRLYQQAKFNQYENETATKWHIPLNVIQQRKYTQAKDGKVYQSVQECEIAYNKCIHENVLHHMKNTLTLSNISPLARIKSWLKSKQSKCKPSLHKPDEMLVEHQKSVIDVHDKRLSQLFKVCYIAAFVIAFISQKMPQIISWFKSANVTYAMLLLWLYSCVIRMNIVCNHKNQYLWLTKTCTHIMYLCGLAWCTVTLW